MKNFLLSLTILLSASLSCFAQKEQVTIKAGTIVPLEAIKEVRGAKAHEGEPVDFQVTRNIIVDGRIAIPAGSLAKGVVYEAKRSTCFGTRGRLGIKIRNLITPNGDIVNFTSSDIYIKGNNRTPVSVVVFCLTCLPFPCGGKAVMKVGYEVDATVASNTTITI